jgi:hypothetical protein
MSEEQKGRLIELARTMRIVAEPFGTMHAWWDTIADIEAFAKGKETLLKQLTTAEEWIEMGEAMLIDYQTSSSNAMAALRSVRARINGEWDEAGLIKLGALMPDTNYDILRLVEKGLRYPHP